MNSDIGFDFKRFFTAFQRNRSAPYPCQDAVRTDMCTYGRRKIIYEQTVVPMGVILDKCMQVRFVSKLFRQIVDVLRLKFQGHIFNRNGTAFSSASAP